VDNGFFDCTSSLRGGSGFDPPVDHHFSNILPLTSMVVLALMPMLMMVCSIILPLGVLVLALTPIWVVVLALMPLPVLDDCLFNYSSCSWHGGGLLGDPCFQQGEQFLPCSTMH
jgi:hypothetical protein